MRCLCLWILFPLTGFSQPSDSLIQAKKAAEQTPKFQSYIFQGEEFPSLEKIDYFSAKITFYNREYEIVTKAKTPGIYGAVIELSGKSLPLSKRYVTLIRAKEKDSVPKHDPQMARRWAGIVLAPASEKRTRKYDDPLAEERQWWVGLKRKLNGWDKQFPKAFKGPIPIQGNPASIVQEGTLQDAGMKADAAEKIDAACQEWSKESDQAFAVCVVRQGVIVLHKAYGVRDGKQMTVETKSWMASITKTMSATLMMMLVDQKLVDLDDEVSRFFPSFEGMKVQKPLKVRNLYNHTGGLGNWPMHDDSLPDIEERLAVIYPHLKVGEKWAYGGTGNVLGGKIIEAVSGECIPKFYQRHLLEPLGCTHTDVSGTHADAFSIPLDAAKFGQLLLNQGSYGSWRFFSPETFQKMLPRKLTEELGKEASKTFGIGLDGTPTKFGHGAASAATFQIDVEKQLVVIITRNKMGSTDEKYGDRFWKAIHEAILKK